MELRSAKPSPVTDLEDLGHRLVTQAVGCSGTIRALVEYAAGDRRREASLGEIADAAEEIAAMSASKRERIFEPRRADMIVPGAAILETAMRHLGVSRIRAVKRGLRDGVLIELARSAASRTRAEAHRAA